MSDPARADDVRADAGIAEAIGGPRGLIDAGLPGVVFAVAYPLTGSDLRTSLYIAVGCGVILFVVGMVQRRPVRQAVAGLFGVGLMAFFAARTGEPEDFFLPSIIKNAAYAAAYALSILLKWPLLGVFLGPVLGEGFAWRQDPARRRAYAQATWIWVAMFGLRLAVQIPLYLAGAVTALGFAGIPLGVPLFLFVGWLTYLVLARTPRTIPPEPSDRV